ncbi:hypothetical protein SAMD00019534_057550 [Acytostelium subglobosum LB1]|uniref:hypothetical protein n=1 Tax=Acytostelium subglobosum LB1 TaxID=1410327 RepID=UPI0006451124|nr:hypothetical protein SAMD00019534_057550 [Acytostelium subglobosum LB1]GAM22580.1 hypothetical protein SAMD00019534_057550 [Acytostelium subglobosum LB1]|eukprot:XP_012754700.1 hypothetical protein SAMD00019534_057550 [Acytostelium subglobosum LB1]
MIRSGYMELLVDKIECKQEIMFDVSLQYLMQNMNVRLFNLIMVEHRSVRERLLADPCLLQFACQSGNIELVKMMLDMADDYQAGGVNRWSTNGQILVWSALVMGHVHIARLLLQEQKREVDLIDNDTRLKLCEMSFVNFDTPRFIIKRFQIPLISTTSEFSINPGLRTEVLGIMVKNWTLGHSFNCMLKTFKVKDIGLMNRLVLVHFTRNIILQTSAVMKALMSLMRQKPGLVRSKLSRFKSTFKLMDLRFSTYDLHTSLNTIQQMLRLRSLFPKESTLYNLVMDRLLVIEFAKKVYSNLDPVLRSMSTNTLQRHCPACNSLICL